MNKKVIIFILIPLFLFGAIQSIQAVTKVVGEAATVKVNCSDSDENLTACDVTTPCSQSCSASGSRGSCSCIFTSSATGTYDACGRAVDSGGLVDMQCESGIINYVECISDGDCGTNEICLDYECANSCGNGICDANENSSSCSADCNDSPDKPGIPSTGPGSGGSGEPYPEGEEWNHCVFQELSLPTFHWTYSDPDSDPQQAYEIRIDNDSNFTIQDPEEMTASGGSSTSFVPLSVDWKNWADWNTNYWWIARVQDNQGNWSLWSDANQFLTPLHAYPWPDFSWTPEEPTEGEVVIFDPDLTQVYGGSSIASYLWTITHGEGGYVEETTNASQYPNVLFSTTDNRMKVQVTDSSGYSCESSEKNIFLTMPLPEYKEIPPVSWWQKIFSIVLNLFKV